jgi:hypothetical protein
MVSRCDIAATKQLSIARFLESARQEWLAVANRLRWEGSSGLRTYMEPMIRSLSADLAAALTHARLPTVTDTARDNQTLAQASRIQELYETFLAEMGLQARRLSALAQECADASHACDKDDTELQTVRTGSEQLQHLNHVHANLQTLAPEVISTLYLHRDCLPEFFGQNSPLVYFAERYASLTEVGGLLTTFRAKEITPTLKLEQMAMAIYASKASGADTFAEAAAAESAESVKPPGGTAPSPPGVPPGVPYDPNTETRAAAVGHLAFGCIALGSNTSAAGDGTAPPSGVPVPPTTPTGATAESPVPGNSVQAKAMEVDAADKATTPAMVPPPQAVDGTQPSPTATWASSALNLESQSILAAARVAGGTVPLFPSPSSTPAIPVAQNASDEIPLGAQADPPAELPASSSSTESGTGASQEMETEVGASKRTAEGDTSEQADAKLPRRAP